MKDPHASEEVIYTSEKGILPVNNPLDICDKPSDAENSRLSDEDGACDDGIN